LIEAQGKVNNMNEKKITEVFSKIDSIVSYMCNNGDVASYIPELSKVNGDKFGIYLSSLSGDGFEAGSSLEKFSIQSISKVFSLVMAFNLEGSELWDRVGVEPSGNAFNSITQLEIESGIPRNPFINAGALLVCDVLVSHLADPKADFLQFVSSLCGSELEYNVKMANSEKQHGCRNTAITYFMKSYGNINNEVEDVLDFYFHLCSIEMTCEELANSMMFLCNGGVNPFNAEVVLSASRTKRIAAIMLLCGFYDEAGEFAFKVGLPGKSGVGGGIVAINPGKYSVAVWSPKLNSKGNSYRGMKILEYLTSETESSVF